MKVFILEGKYREGDLALMQGVYSSKELACAAMQGEMVDYERISDTEEMYETDEAIYYITDATLDEVIL